MERRRAGEDMETSLSRLRYKPFQFLFRRAMCCHMAQTYSTSLHFHFVIPCILLGRLMLLAFGEKMQARRWEDQAGQNCPCNYYAVHRDGIAVTFCWQQYLLSFQIQSTYLQIPSYLFQPHQNFS